MMPFTRPPGNKYVPTGTMCQALDLDMRGLTLGWLYPSNPFQRLPFAELFKSMRWRFHLGDCISFHARISSFYVMFNLNHIITITNMTCTGRAGNGPSRFSESARLSWRKGEHRAGGQGGRRLAGSHRQQEETLSGLWEH